MLTRVLTETSFHSGERPAPFLELALGVKCQEVRELLRCRLLWTVPVSRAFAGVAHGCQEPQLVLGAHHSWSLRVVLDEFVDEEVLTGMRSSPNGIANEVLVQALEHLGIGQDNSVLPPVSQ